MIIITTIIISTTWSLLSSPSLSSSSSLSILTLGSPRQCIHADTIYLPCPQYPDAHMEPLYTFFVALQDVTDEMGMMMKWWWWWSYDGDEDDDDDSYDNDDDRW